MAFKLRLRCQVILTNVVYAADWSQRAEFALTPEVRGRLIAAAEMWERLAAKLEAEQPLLQTLFELESNETYDILPRALHLNTWEASDSPVFLPGLVSSD